MDWISQLSSKLSRISEGFKIIQTGKLDSLICSGWTFWKDRSCLYDQLIFAHANWITGRVTGVKRLECSKMWLLPCYLDASPSQISFFNLSDTSRCQGFDFFEKPPESVLAVHKGASVKEWHLAEIT